MWGQFRILEPVLLYLGAQADLKLRISLELLCVQVQRMIACSKLVSLEKFDRCLICLQNDDFV